MFTFVYNLAKPEYDKTNKGAIFLGGKIKLETKSLYFLAGLFPNGCQF